MSSSMLGFVAAFGAGQILSRKNRYGDVCKKITVKSLGTAAASARELMNVEFSREVSIIYTNSSSTRGSVRTSLCHTASSKQGECTQSAEYTLPSNGTRAPSTFLSGQSVEQIGLQQ